MVWAMHAREGLGGSEGLHGADLSIVEDRSILCSVARGSVGAFSACGSCHCLGEPGRCCLYRTMGHVSMFGSSPHHSSTTRQLRLLMMLEAMANSCTKRLNGNRQQPLLATPH